VRRKNHAGRGPGKKRPIALLKAPGGGKKGRLIPTLLKEGPF